MLSHITSHHIIPRRATLRHATPCHHTDTHTHTCKHIHTQTHVHTYTHTHTPHHLHRRPGPGGAHSAALWLWVAAVQKRGTPALPYPLPVGLWLSKNEVHLPYLTLCRLGCDCPKTRCARLALAVLAGYNPAGQFAAHPPAKDKCAPRRSSCRQRGCGGGCARSSPSLAAHQLPLTSSAPHQQPALPLTNNQLCPSPTTSCPSPALPLPPHLPQVVEVCDEYDLDEDRRLDAGETLLLM